MRILTLSTYPIAIPRHGGQQRLHHIARAFRDAGHEVQSLGVLGGGHYAPEEGFLPFPGAERLKKYLPNPFLMEDWAIGRLAATDDQVFDALCSRVIGIPDVIHAEQPWLFAFARRLLQRLGAVDTLLVYGSQNVEHELKRRIVAGYMGEEHAEQCARIVLECELEAATNCRLAVATSRSDADWLRSHIDCELILAPNGVPERNTTIEGVIEANRITGHAASVLYCASAHPPNVVGFFEMFGRGIGFLTPDERIVVAGSAGKAIREDPRFARTPGLSSHYVEAGEVSEECLQGLLETCHAIALPITQGGGTNLKTAEALWAGRWVVSTPVAMRGFEHFAAQRGVSVHGDPLEFRAATRTAMDSPPLQLTGPERAFRRSLLWESTLGALVDRLAGAVLR